MTLIFHGYSQKTCSHCSGLGCDDCAYDGHEFVEVDVMSADTKDETALIRGLDRMCVEIHGDNRRAGWWTDLVTGADTLETRNRGEMLMLCVTELTEAEMAAEQGAMDDKLPQYEGLHVELADTAIRLFDLIGAEQRRGGKYPLVTFHAQHGTLHTWEIARFISRWGAVQSNLMLIVRDLSRALDEGYRKDNITLARYWITRALFSVIAYCALRDIPLFEIIEEKREFNRNRADHKIENRRKDGGKKL